MFYCAVEAVDETTNSQNLYDCSTDDCSAPSQRPLGASRPQLYWFGVKLAESCYKLQVQNTKRDENSEQIVPKYIFLPADPAGDGPRWWWRFEDSPAQRPGWQQRVNTNLCLERWPQVRRIHSILTRYSHYGIPVSHCGLAVSFQFLADPSNSQRAPLCPTTRSRYSSPSLVPTLSSSRSIFQQTAASSRLSRLVPLPNAAQTWWQRQSAQSGAQRPRKKEW